MGQFVELLKPKIAALPSDRSRILFFTYLHHAAAKKLDEIGEPPGCLLRPVTQPATTGPAAPTNHKPLNGQSSIELDIPDGELNAEVIEALKIANEIIEKAESGDVPFEGQEFAESVCEKARGIYETVNERRSVTHKQLTSLSNMLDGLDRWLERVNY